MFDKFVKVYYGHYRPYRKFSNDYVYLDLLQVHYKNLFISYIIYRIFSPYFTDWFKGIQLLGFIAISVYLYVANNTPDCGYRAKGNVPQGLR